MSEDCVTCQKIFVTNFKATVSVFSSIQILITVAFAFPIKCKMNQVIVFDKTFQERLQEYVDIFSIQDAVSASQVKEIWSYYLAFGIDSIDPNGWQAMWKISRLTCEKLNISFPTVVLVYVEQSDVETHSAYVKILAVQDDIHLPDKHVVPLTQLWPTKGQDKSVVLNIMHTARVIDSLRFFYNHLFMPWDLEESENTNWVEEHLEVRLRLFYDMKNGNIRKSTAEQIRALIAEAKRLQVKREQLKLELPEDTDDLKDKNVQMLLEISVRLMQIKNEFELLENPLARMVLFKSHQEETSDVHEGTPRFWIVYAEGTLDDYIHFLQQLKTYYPNNIFKYASNLNTVLDLMYPNDTIILNPTHHSITNIGMLETGGTLKGVPSKTDTILTSKIDDVMLDFRGIVSLENLTVEINFARCGIVVRGGKLSMVNCKIVGNNRSSTCQGIIVLAGGRLELIDCSVAGFSTAVVGNSGAGIFLKNCDIHGVNVGLRLYDECLLKAECTTLRDCKEYGICLETDNEVKSRVCSFASLEISPDISVENLVGENNQKGDVFINSKSKIQPMEDMFSPTATSNSNSAEDDVDTMSEDGELNATVIEVVNTS